MYLRVSSCGRSKNEGDQDRRGVGRNGSRRITSTGVLEFTRWLVENHSTRKEPKFFLPEE